MNKRLAAALVADVSKFEIKGASFTLEELSRAYEESRGACVLCDTVPAGNARSEALCLDHDHVTGKLRGLLCAKCNMALGLFKDSPELLEAAAAYLRRHGK